MNPTPEEAIKIVEVIIAFARLADVLQGAVVLQICGGKQAFKVMLPELKKRMKSSCIRIIILNENSLHMSHYGRINPRVFFTKEIQQHLLYKDFHQLHLSLAKTLKQLKTMGILENSTITFSQMLEWAQPLAGIKDHSNTPAETTNAYDADYKKRCVIRGANFHRSTRLKWLHNRLVNLNVDLKVARNEASHERVTALEIEIDAMNVDKNVLESQTAEQRVAAYALRDREHDPKRAAKELVEEARRTEKVAEDEAKSVAKAERDRKRAEKAEEEAQRAAKVVERDARWTPVVDAEIERMIDEGYSYDKIASKLGSGLKMHDIKNRWNRHLNELSSIIKPAVQTGFPSSITWTADVDTTIVRMRADDISFAKIASELGHGLKRSDIKNRWNRHLKDKRSECIIRHHQTKDFNPTHLDQN